MTSPSSMHETGHSKPVNWDNPEGWDGREVGEGSGWETHVHPWLIHVNIWQKPPQYCKVISLQLKLIKFLKISSNTSCSSRRQMTTQITRQSGRSPQPPTPRAGVTSPGVICEGISSTQQLFLWLRMWSSLPASKLLGEALGAHGPEGRALPSHLRITPALLPPSPGTTYFSSGHSGLPLNPPQPREYAGRSFYKEGKGKCPIFVM